jgi:hypothetical protein
VRLLGLSLTRSSVLETARRRSRRKARRKEMKEEVES